MSLDPKAREALEADGALIWSICERLLLDGKTCQKCPHRENTPYGKGVRGCRLDAEDTAALGFAAGVAYGAEQQRERVVMLANQAANDWSQAAPALRGLIRTLESDAVDQSNREQT